MKTNRAIPGVTYFILSFILFISCKNENAVVLPELETATITEITQTTALTGGTIIFNGSFDITARGVCWDTDPRPSLTDQYTSEVTEEDIFHSTISGLTPEKEYHVRAYATNNLGTNYGDEKTFRTLSAAGATQIIADHTVVDRFDDIPQYYIDEVKKMWLAVPGESHSEAYRVGLELLEASYPKYAVNVTTSGTPEAYTTSHLRTSRATWGDYDTPEGWIHWYGEEDWFTNAAAIAQTKKSISYCNDNGYEIAAIGFGWCYDMVGWHAPAYGADPVYGCRWYGDAIGSPDSQLAWGLDAGDYAITGNSVCMDTYLNATQSYIDYCTTKGYDTKVFFTTGPIQNQTSYEPSYQGHVKHEYIRAFVAADPTRILFDYNDILAYNDDGSQNLLTWNGHTYPVITVTNLGDKSIGHIGSAGAIRLAKAMWWMLARIAGWDGN